LPQISEGVSQKNKSQVVEYGIPGQFPEFSAYNQETEVIKSDKAAAENSKVISKVSKSDIRARHGYVKKNNEKQYCRGAHEYQCSAIPQLLTEGSALPRFHLFGPFMIFSILS
jgi:hypothetical protein